MSAVCEVPVAVADELPGVEARVAFLRAAMCAIAEMGEDDLNVQTGPEVWRGLLHWTQDLEDMLRRLNELANSE
ncbi:hypothetical protein [uncultured Desulfovibrio sp.]|uniref:hypothetical protein n=1 Tax=uncultured Desulfovibrio sp. TaxID=167968 RepID=UPI00262D47E7|nr:hypothetical protein [uncultured Desulfovibrio sp.]